MKTNKFVLPKMPRDLDRPILALGGHPFLTAKVFGFYKADKESKFVNGFYMQI